jgi:multiple antibiotic resistance protein
MMMKHILYSTAALLALTAPLAELPIFLAVTAGQTSGQRRRSALKVAGGALMVLGISTMAGAQLLAFVGVSLAAFKSAGGLVVIIVGLEMLHGGSAILKDVDGEVHADDALWVPLVMPLIAGPAAITAVITLSIREVQRGSGVIPVGTLLAVTLSAFAVLLTLLFAMPLSKLVGVRAARIVERFFGLILVAIGFQMGFSGIQEFFWGV